MEREVPNRRAAPGALAVTLLLALLIGACDGERSVQPVLEINPYGFGAAEHGATLGALHQALTDSAVLNAMTRPRLNPYGFEAADTLFAREQMDAAVTFRARLQRAKEQSAYSILDSCMTTAEVYYYVARPYWEEEARKLNEEALVFWRSQREVADSTHLVDWIAFSSAMVELESSHLTMVNAILNDIEHDIYSYGEGAGDILDRKIACQDSGIFYYSGVIRCLIQGLVLSAPKYDRLGEFIASYDVICSGLRYWRQERIAIRDSQVPFWSEELLRAEATSNAPWGGFVGHMIQGLHERDAFASASILDLSADSLLVQPGGRECAVGLLRRKTILNMHRRTYYRRLLTLIAEGQALAILRPPTE